jgi:hypothetical protein
MLARQKSRPGRSPVTTLELVVVVPVPVTVVVEVLVPVVEVSSLEKARKYRTSPEHPNCP